MPFPSSPVPGPSRVWHRHSGAVRGPIPRRIPKNCHSAAIRQVDDLPSHVLLWPNNRIGWIVPKRAFATPDEAAAFDALAKEKTVDQTL